MTGGQITHRTQEREWACRQAAWDLESAVRSALDLAGVTSSRASNLRFADQMPALSAAMARLDTARTAAYADALRHRYGEPGTRGLPILWIPAETGVAEVIVTDDGTSDGRVVQEHLLGPGARQWAAERAADINPD